MLNSLCWQQNPVLNFRRIPTLPTVCGNSNIQSFVLGEYQTFVLAAESALVFFAVLSRVTPGACFGDRQVFPRICEQNRIQCCVLGWPEPTVPKVRSKQRVRVGCTVMNNKSGWTSMMVFFQPIPPPPPPLPFFLMVQVSGRFQIILLTIC